MTDYGVLTKRKIGAWIGILLIVVAAVSVCVGFVAATGHESFNWEVASIFGTALGTTALAGFTGALAFTTSGDVQATWRLATLTQEQQASASRPLVFPSPTVQWLYQLPPYESLEFKRRVLPVTNAGQGPALNVRGRLHWHEPELTVEFVPTSLAPGAAQEILLEWRTEPDRGRVQRIRGSAP